jgi:cell division protein FtsW (lipid II flippase)
MVGLIVMMLSYFLIGWGRRIGAPKSILITAIILIVLAIGSIFAYRQPRLKDFFTHGGSSDMRIEQYQRLWHQKNEIGWVGRGLGTAGPSSINRLDNGPNHWTENIYLDLFEETGLVGIVIYLALIISLIIEVAKIDTMEKKTAFLLLAGFSVAGLFINYYTGQVGIYLFWLAMGLAVDKERI